MEKFKVNILGCGAAIPIGIRKIRVKWQIWRGQAIDIWSKSAYPADVLSNLCSNGFRFDGVVCGCMEEFLQSLKQQDLDKQRQICSMKGGNARKRSVTSWQTDQILRFYKIHQ